MVKVMVEVKMVVENSKGEGDEKDEEKMVVVSLVLSLKLSPE